MLVRHEWVNRVFLTLALISLRYNEPNGVHLFTQYSNMLLTIVFVFEMLIKILGLGVKGYLSSFGNWFDGLVTLVRGYDGV